MNIIIYTLLILIILYFLLRWWSNISTKKMSKSVRLITIFLLVGLAVLFAVGGKFLLTLPLTLMSLALLKLKGLSLIQIFSLYRLIQTLRNSGRFSFNQNQNYSKSSSLSLDEAYLDVTGSELYGGSATLIAEAIRMDIYEEHKITASAGVAPNKFLRLNNSTFDK